MKKIAVVTGASGGLGKAFVELMLREDVEEIWCIARNEEKLHALKNAYGEKIVVLPLDLSDAANIERIGALLKERRASVSYLINNAGVGEKLAPYENFTLAQISNLITVNCTSVVSLCAVCIPYMGKGSRLINLASQSAFQPVPYLNLYASSKAFIRHYTRALAVELKSTGITATAVCPGWVDTGMLTREIGGKPVHFPGLTGARRVAEKALSDAKKNKDMSVCTLYVKYMHLLAKLFPQKAVMKGWVASVKKYL